jgi:hypothetical protein
MESAPWIFMATSDDSFGCQMKNDVYRMLAQDFTYKPVISNSAPIYNKLLIIMWVKYGFLAKNFYVKANHLCPCFKQGLSQIRPEETFKTGYKDSFIPPEILIHIRLIMISMLPIPFYGA